MAPSVIAVLVSFVILEKINVKIGAPNIATNVPVKVMADPPPNILPQTNRASPGTAAIKIALLAAGVKPNDEVITQSFTFIAVIEAIVDVGAIPVAGACSCVLFHPT